MDSDVRDSDVGNPFVRPNQLERSRYYGTSGFDSKIRTAACCHVSFPLLNHAISDIKVNTSINPLNANGCFMYRQFNIQPFHALPTQCIYMFCVDLRTNSHYFPIQQ